jgi:molecular chaperone GrpE
MAKETKPVDKETPKIEDVPEMTDAESNEMMDKILNAFKEADTETPLIENKEAEYLDKIARLQAEFDNSRKRMEKEKQEIMLNANANLISEILPTLDHFELALKHNKDPGVEMIYDELKETLGNFGLKVIKTDGVFNPNVHEAVMCVEGDEDGAILEELQKGYLINDKLLRASKVKINRTKDTK